MKKLYIRFALAMLINVVCSSIIATVLAFIIANFLFPELLVQKGIVVFGIRELLIPMLTIFSSLSLISFLSKKAVNPIVTLSKATKQIAKGDFSVSIDMADRKDEIGDLVHNFNLMAQELKSIEVLKKDFITNVSHELRTPLAIIQGFGKLLADDALAPDERRQAADRLTQESQRLIKLTSNILRLSKLESQSITPMCEIFQMDEQIRQAIVALQPAWTNRAITFDVMLRPTVYTGDEELLSQVWFNLIDNAIKFSHDGGIIKVRMNQTSKFLQVKITDSGIGMDNATCVHIFDQFYQGDTSLRKDGSGLGLSIVKRIVDIHGGSVEVFTRLGEGTCFTVLLPVT